MADLEAAADAALAKVKELEGEIAEAEEAISALKEEMARLGQRTGEDAAAVDAKARALLDRLHQVTERLGQDGQEAASALSELEAAAESARPECEQAIGEGRAQVAAFGEQLEAARPQAEAMVQQGQAALDALEQYAAQIGESVQQALADAREFVEGQVVTGLQAMKDDVEREAEDAARSIGEDLPSSISESYDHWAAKVGELQSFIEEFFGDAQQQVDEGVSRCLEECTRAQMEALEAVVEHVNGSLVPGVEQLQSTVRQEAGVMDSSCSALEAALDKTGGALQSAIAALEGVKENLASYTFVPL